MRFFLALADRGHTAMTSGLQVTGKVFGSEASIVSDQAENRVRATTAVLADAAG